MKNPIFIVGILLFAFGSTGSVLLDIRKRRNRRATPTRHRRRHRRGAPYYGGWTGWGDDGREQSGDDWGSGTWSSNDQGGGDWGSGTWGGSSDWSGGDSGGGGGGSDSGGGGSD